MIRCIVLVFFCSIAGAQDPCDASVYKALDPERRMVSNQIMDIADASCDSNLKAAWYRVVDGPAGSDMPTVCPVSFSCGTAMPVWLRDALPLDPGEMDAIACQRDFTSCCPKTIPIKIKNCGNYFVYFLNGSLLTCDAVFCFGTQAPCQPGESSETGYGPGCSTNFPAISGPPGVELYTDLLPRPSLYFRCALPNMDPALFYDVDWFYNKEKIHSPRAVSGARIKDSDMADAHWYKDGRKMGFDVSCAIRARSSPDGTPSPWLKSPSRFIGIKVLTPTVTIKERETAEIHLQMTAPFPCGSMGAKLCAIKVGSAPQYNKTCTLEYTVNEQQCKHTIYGDQWNVTQKYRIKAKTDMKALSWDVENFVVLETESVLGNTHYTWKDYQLPPVIVTVVNNENKGTQVDCHSVNDPHFKTFDGHLYDFYGEGEFILYKSTTKPIEVHAIFTSCNGIASCNCAIAVRAGLDLFAINKCSGHKNQGEIECGAHGHLRIFSLEGGRRTKVHFPSGAIVEIKEEGYVFGKYFNVFVTVGQVEYQQTDGLCGNFDKNPNNDGPAIEREKFYRVSEKDSFFLPPDKLQGWDSVRAGQCKCDQQENGTLECDWSDGVEVKLECLPPGYRDLTCHRRSKRDVMQEDYHGFDFDDFERVPDAEHAPDLSWKGNWTEAKAKDFCQNYVQQFEVVQKCAADLGIETNSSVDTCVLDIQLTGDASWAQTALENIKSRCMAELNFDSKYWVSDNTSANSSLSLRDQMEAITCPEECNFRGTCVNGSCQCQAGYRGVSCDVDMSKGPDVTHIPRRGLCDVREKPCRMTAVLGDSFLDSANLTCRLSSFLVNETGVEEVGEVHQVPGVFESYAEVLCPAHSPRERRDTPSTMTSTGAHGYMISVANDGVLFGTPLPFVIFDSRCLDCQKSPDSITCDLKPDTCFIEGACYTPGEGPYDKTCVECRPAHSQREWHIKAGTCLVEGNCFQDGAKNPRDPCYLCDSAFSLTVWKTNDECTDRKLWIIGAVLGSLLLVLVAVFLIWKFKVNRKQKVGDSMQDFSAVRTSTKAS